ncbi:hypothetical protein AVEN_66846-1 [Araneus ventricosus]|uniref:Uncharacterized protein n=1 Tax=Araneus ventricosus TaxID=182803 RepID=A0A4Y2DQP8_ARAVE|nr:hypothetical protein AVEN_66846-1 [Araneus ventricosus]
METREGTYTASSQRLKQHQRPGNDQRSYSPTGQGPFPSYCKRFHLRLTDRCGCGEVGSHRIFPHILPFNKAQDGIRATMVARNNEKPALQHQNS